MYVKINAQGGIEKYPYTPRELRKGNTQVSFPSSPSEELLKEWGVFPVIVKNPPAYNLATQDCVRVNPTLHGEQWVETWEVRDLTDEEKTARTEERAAQVRATRASLLLQNVDSISHIRWGLMSEEDKEIVLTYRQALLDVSQQEGFPWEVVWPEAPSL